MRDPERIPRILAKLGEAWNKCPDMRLGQIVCCVFPYSGINPIFQYEDTLFEAGLDEYLGQDA